MIVELVALLALGFWVGLGVIVGIILLIQRIVNSRTKPIERLPDDDRGE